MNISYINFSIPLQNIGYDYFWLSAKSYVEDNYQGSVRWNWSYPLSNSEYDTVDDIVEIILSQNPNVVLLSLYVWNHALSYKVAQAIKKANKDVTIVVGGPHVEYSRPDYFIAHRYVDFCCETDGYGEVFLNEFLHQYETNKDWSKVPYLKSMGFSSNVPFSKRDFKWPRNIFSRNKEYLEDRKTAALLERQNLVSMYETSRGCPYGCTYCEWGGGTNSKVAFKPLEYILEDFEFLFKEIKPDVIGLTDANFGIVERDIDIAKSIALHKEQYGYPKFAYMFGPSKKNKHNVYEIERIFAKAKMIDEFKVSVQDLNESVMDNIKRTDTPWREQYESYNELRKSHEDIRIRLELILGLPGTTIKDYYDALDIMCPEVTFGTRYIWHLLPTTPAAKPEYIEQHKIKTLSIKHVQRPEFKQSKSLIYKDEFIIPSNIVIGTYSYTPEEWFEMFMMDRIISSTEVEGFLRYISRYASEVMGIPHSKFYNRYWNTFINNNDYLPPHQQSIFKNIIDEGMRKIKSDYVDDIEDYKLPKPLDGYAMIIRHHKLAVHINRNSYYSGLREWAKNEFGYDEGMDDIIKWTANMVIFLDHDPENPNSFESKYDWYSWINGSELKKINCINTPRDTSRTISFMNVPIEWHKYSMEERIKRFFVSICSEYEVYSLFKNVEVTHVN